jgi:hypothetical protein
MPIPLRIVILVVSYLGVGAWLILNVQNRVRLMRIGLGVVLLGWLMNALVVIANDGMPVSSSALAQLGLHASSVSSGGPLGKHVSETSAILGPLGDNLAVPFLGTILSIGDLIIAAGLTLLIVSAMCIAAPSAGLSATRSRVPEVPTTED